MSEVQQILTEANVLRKDYVNIDLLLDQPETLKKVADAIAKLISEKEKDSFDLIVVADKISGPFGPLPLGVILSVSLNKPLLIWKELLVGVHKFFGNIDPKKGATQKKRVLVFHDVVLGGNTIYKIVRDLEEGGFEVSKVLSVVDRCKERSPLFKEIEGRGVVESLVKF